MNAHIVRRIKHLQRWDSGTIKVLGYIELLLALILTITSIYALIAKEDAFLYIPIIPFVLGLGLFQVLFFSAKTSLTPALGILLIAEMWVLSFTVSAIPFLLYGYSVLDSAFEAISCYTTTGATVIADFDVLPRSLLFWRAIMVWAGGITVLISFSFILPMIGMAGAGLNSNEFAGSDSDNYSMKISSASLSFLKVYVLLTVAEAIILLLCGLTGFESVCIALANVPTGGVLPSNDGMISYSIPVQAVTMVFMLLGSLNFYLLFRLIFKKDGAVFKSKETRFMLKWFLFCAVLMFISFALNYDVTSSTDTILETAWHSLYMSISFGTSTGFTVIDLASLPYFVFFILYLLEFMGGCSGSTTGGAKIYRLMTVKSYVINNISRVLHPNAVVSIRSDGKNMSDEAVNSAISTILLFIIALFVGLGIVMSLEPDIADVQTYFGIVLSALTNVGTGPFVNYGIFTVGTKIFLCFMMWLGRMELILILILFTRALWTDVRLSMGKMNTTQGARHHHRHR